MKVKKDVDMKYVCKKQVLSYLILLGLLCDVCTAKQVENIEFAEEFCVVACLPGKGPGQYYYFRKAGYDLRPRCFAIDPNDGAFYIPEVDMYNNIRLHKFDREGNFIAMIKPEGKATLVSNIAIASNGDIFMDVDRIDVEMFPTHFGNCICRFDCEGKLLNRFGPKGPITKEDLEAERKAKEQDRQIPTREKYFPGGSRIFILPNNEVFVVVRHYYWQSLNETFRFDGRSGRLIRHVEENRNLPKEIAKKKAGHLKKLEALHKAEHEQKRITGRAHSLIGPDGLFYYMSVTPQRLEIRQVLFYE